MKKPRSGSAKPAIRNIMNIELDLAAVAALDKAAETLHAKKKHLASRLFQWFVEQDATVHAVIAGNIPDAIKPDISGFVKAHFERLAHAKK